MKRAFVVLLFLSSVVTASEAAFAAGFAANEHKAPTANWSFAPPSATVDSLPSARDIRRLFAGMGKR